MKPSYQLLICLIVSLFLFRNLFETEIIDLTLASRLLVLSTVLPPLVILIHSRIKLLKIFHSSEKLFVKEKFISITFFLMTLLIYSHLMAQFNIKLFSTFAFQYLLILPVLLILLPWYLRFCSKRQKSPDDEYARFGSCLLKQQKFVFSEHKELVLQWMVKIFFIPIMVGGLLDVTEFLLSFNWDLKPLTIISGLFFFGLTFDLIIASVGYVCASKVLGNEVKSTDTSVGGWFICLICYPPLLIFYQWFAKQTDDLLWHDWLSVDQPLYWFWAFIIITTWMIYWWSTAQFGWHFSNLTWRKLVDYGPYRYTKHPAYIAKNIYWWMHTVPFIGVATQQDLFRNLAGMVFVSTVYYLRAKTEERHLLKFAEYQEYATYIAQHGLFSRVKLKLQKLTQ